MKSSESRWQRVAILLFACMLILPLLLFNRQPGSASVLENKNTAVLPDFSAFDSPFDKRIPQELDEFFTDNIGLKEQGTLAHISLMYRLFHQVAVTDDIEGKSHHLFYLAPHILNTYQGLDAISDAEMDPIVEKMQDLNNTVTSSGAEFVFMPIPNKEEIYPEYMPDNIHVASEDSFLHALKNRLLADGQIATVDTEQALLDAKETVDGLLYYRNMDPSHWNANGMLAGYLALMDTLQARDASIKGFQREELNVTSESVHLPFHTLAQYPSISASFSDMNDEVYNVTPLSGFSGVLDNTQPAGFSLNADTRNLYFHYHNDNARNQKSVLIYGDSYIHSFMLSLLSETFSDVYFFAASVDASTVSEFLELVSPNIILYESVARMINSHEIPAGVARLQDAVSAKNTAQTLSALPVLDEAPVLGFDAASIQNDRQISLADCPDGLFMSGWAADSAADAAVSKVYLRIGTNLIATEPMGRPDLGSSCYNAGFSVTLPRSSLENAEQIEILAINAAGNALLAPVILPIRP